MQCPLNGVSRTNRNLQNRRLALQGDCLLTGSHNDRAERICGSYSAFEDGDEGAIGLDADDELGPLDRRVDKRRPNLDRLSNPRDEEQRAS